MKPKQAYTLLNTVTEEILGKTGVVAEDLSNIVDVGKQVFGATDVDNYVKSLVNHIGRVIFVDRVYNGGVPSILRDGWEFASVMQKIHTTLPKAVINESWELQDGASYDPFIFHSPNVSAKFFNSKVVFEVDMSFPEVQVKESFSNPGQMVAFLSMLSTSVKNSMTVKLDELIMRTINNMTAETLAADYPTPTTTTPYSGSSHNRSVNLLYLYNTKFSKSLTIDDVLTDPDFIRFAVYTILVTKKRLSKYSTLFNIGESEKFTTEDRLNIIMLEDFKAAADVYLQSTTFNNEYVKLPNADTVPYWQGTGTGYGFGDISEINISKTGSGKQNIHASGILCVMSDRDAIGVCNLNERVRSQTCEKAEFYNNFYKSDGMYYNDLNENYVVFFVA